MGPGLLGEVDLEDPSDAVCTFEGPVSGSLPRSGRL
jgi:hypothetical protein